MGKLLERKITEAIRASASPKGFNVGPTRLVNGAANRFQIDCVVSDRERRPIIIIDPKYIRYTKHNRDKGSWLCVAHYNLMKTFPSIRKSITVLSGNWSAPSIALIRSFGIEVHLIPFQHIVDTLAGYRIPFDWHEKDTVTSVMAWDRFLQLEDNDKEAIADAIIAPVIGHVVRSVETTLDADLATIQRRVTQVELTLKTSHGEMIASVHSTIREAAQRLLSLLEDRPDIGHSVR